MAQDKRSDVSSKPGSSGWDIALSRSDVGDRPYLGSMDDVQSVVRKFSVGVTERFREVAAGNMSKEDAVRADQFACAKMASAFLGKDEGFRTVGSWNDSGAIAKHIRRLFPEHFDDGDEASDEVVMQQAFAMLAHSIYDLIADEDANPAQVNGYISWMTLALLGLPIKEA